MTDFYLCRTIVQEVPVNALVPCRPAPQARAILYLARTKTVSEIYPTLEWGTDSGTNLRILFQTGVTTAGHYVPKPGSVDVNQPHPGE